MREVRGQRSEGGISKALAVMVLLLSAYCFLLTPAYPAGSLLFYPKFKAFDANGAPLIGGKVYTYEPGTVTAKTTYNDRDLAPAHANANPVVLDANAEATIYLDGLTKIVLKDSSDVVIWTMDNVSAGSALEYTGAPGTIAVFTGPGGVSGYGDVSGNSITPGTLPSNRLYEKIAQGVETTSPISTTNYNIGMIQFIDVSTPGPTVISGASGQWYSAVSEVGRAPLSGVSFRLASPTKAGENAVFFLKHKTSDSAFGTTTYVLFTTGDTIWGADSIIAGTSKYMLSGVTDAQTVVALSIGVSTWFIKHTGAPSVVKQ